MKANELRIGNWYDEFSVPKQVTASTILEVWKEKRAWCKPIPLTEEWLLKFGFKKVVTDTEDSYGIDYNLEVPDICYISYSNDFSCAIYGSEYASKNSIGAVPNWNSIKYVHGLQNLYFALTGEELTIGGQDGSK